MSVLVEVLLDSGLRLQSKTFEVWEGADIRQCIHDNLLRTMVETVCLLDIVTGEVLYEAPSLTRLVQRGERARRYAARRSKTEEKCFMRRAIRTAKRSERRATL